MLRVKSKNINPHNNITSKVLQYSFKIINKTTEYIYHVSIQLNEMLITSLILESVITVHQIKTHIECIGFYTK